jgi:hypothetical protein
VTHNRPNKALVFYLTWVNPLLAIAVFYFCSWQSIAALVSESGSSGSAGGAKASILGSPDGDPFAMYFLGKGIFCSSALFLFGLFFREYHLRRAPIEAAEP